MIGNLRENTRFAVQYIFGECLPAVHTQAYIEKLQDIFLLNLQSVFL